MKTAAVLETVIFSIPEAVAITLLAVSLSGERVPWTKVVSVGILLGTAAYFLRLLTSTYILNVFSYTLTLIIFLSLFQIGRLLSRASSASIAISLYLGLEFLNIKVSQLLFHITPVDLNNILLRLMLFIPQLVIAILLAVTLSSYKFSLFPDDEFMDTDKEASHEK